MVRTGNEKACEVVKETVQEETKQADMRTVEEYKDWLSSPERTADKKLRDYVVKHLGRLLEVLKTGTEKLTKKIMEKLQEPEKTLRIWNRSKRLQEAL